MGVTRKLLSLSTYGLIDFRSDKERIARSARKSSKVQQKLLKIEKRLERAREEGMSE